MKFKGILVLFLIIVIGVNIWVFKENKRLDTIVWENTYVNGIDISLTKIEDLENKLEEISTDLLNVEKTIKYSEEDKVIKIVDLETTTNSKQIYNEILQKQKGNFFTKYIQYFKTKDLEKKYSLEYIYNEDKIYSFLKDNFESVVNTNGSINYSLKDNALELSVDKSVVIDYDKTIAEIISTDIVVVSTEEVVPEINKEELVSFLEKKSSKVETKPKNASISFENGELIVVDGYNGKTVDIENTKLKIDKALKKEENLIPLVFKETEPEVTAKDLQDRIGNINILLGSFSTSYSSSAAGRRYNVELAAKKINGKVLAPNEVFSYNSMVAPVTSAGGYQTATVFQGNKAVPGIGGGICQVSSTLYNAVLYSNLEIVERHNHGLPVGYVKPSLDATVASGSGLDFRFKNTSGGYIYIRTITNNGKLTIEIYGEKKDFEVVLTSKTISSISPKVERILDKSLEAGTEKVISNGANGYISEAYIKVTKNGKVVREERLSKDTYRATVKEIHYNE